MSSSSTTSSSPPSLTELADTLGARLRAPYRHLQRRLYAQLEQKFPDIRRSHSAVFRHLGEHGARLTDLADQAEMTKQSMAYLVGHLVERGYLKTGKHPDDGRAVCVELTAKGRRFIEAALAASAEIERQIAAELGVRKMAQLRDLLAEVNEIETRLFAA